MKGKKSPCACTTKQKARRRVAEWDRLWSTLVQALKQYEEAWSGATTVSPERRRRAADLQRAARAVADYDARHGFKSLDIVARIAREGPPLGLPPARARRAAPASRSAAAPVDSIADLFAALAAE